MIIKEMYDKAAEQLIRKPPSVHLADTLSSNADDDAKPAATKAAEPASSPARVPPRWVTDARVVLPEQLRAQLTRLRAAYLS